MTRVLLGISLLALLLVGCRSEPKADGVPIEPIYLGQKIDLSFMGLTLEVPEDWDVYQQTRTRNLPDAAHVFLADGYTDSTQFPAGRTDAIHLTMLRCASKQQRVSHLRTDTGIRRPFERKGRIVRELHPGDAALPFSQGTGFEAVIEHKRDSTWATRAYGLHFAHADHCYSMTIENLDMPFQEHRPTYEAILRSIAFKVQPAVEAGF